MMQHHLVSAKYSLLRNFGVRQKANVKVTFYAIHFHALNVHVQYSNQQSAQYCNMSFYN